jgi:hypothetical protein
MSWAAALLARVPWQAWAVGAFIVIGGMVHWARVQAAYTRGYAAAIEAVREANAKAGRKADEGERAVTRCFDDGGEWNREAGRCDMP